MQAKTLIDPKSAKTSVRWILSLIFLVTNNFVPTSSFAESIANEGYSVVQCSAPTDSSIRWRSIMAIVAVNPPYLRVARAQALSWNSQRYYELTCNSAQECIGFYNAKPVVKEAKAPANWQSKEFWIEISADEKTGVEALKFRCPLPVN